MGWYSYDRWRPYVPVDERRRRAARKIAGMKKEGRKVAPVKIDGRKIAATFWGNAWCSNLEAYSDFSNRLPRGRTYVRNGSVIDLQIEAGRVRSLVSGRDIYEVEIKITPLPKKRWTDIKGRCAGRIDSLVELLRGSISRGVMQIVTSKGQGLFPSPREISLDCSCPDWALMCKHVAATLYGVGARLDHRPELLFTLRGVDPTEMVRDAVDQPPAAGKRRKGRVLASDDLSSVFGVDIDMNGIGKKNGGKKSVATKKTTAGKTVAAKKKPTGKKVAATRKPTKKKVAATRKPTKKKVAATRKPTKKKATAKRKPMRNKATATGKPAGKKAATKKPTGKKATVKRQTSTTAKRAWAVPDRSKKKSVRRRGADASG